MIKLLVPDMPTADDLLPYLRRIDAARVYVNNGPLVQELQARLEQMTGAHVALVSNGTVALELALKAATEDLVTEEEDGLGFDHNEVLMPALTFSATGLAALNAGLVPRLTDCDRSSWQMRATEKINPHVAAVLPVATFGVPVETRQFNYYRVPVVIDAAGAFPYQEVSKDKNITTCFSLHATKFIGCGEGGFVASANKERIERIRSLSSFGENGTNAKMSEYHAAVALASLDRMTEKERKSSHIRQMYAEHFAQIGELRYSVSSTLLNVLLPMSAAKIIPLLLEKGIETKQWYRPYLDERIEFMDGRGTTCGKFPVTDHLRGHLLGLPFHNFLTEDDVKYVCNKLAEVLK
jgi:dTDP-4-amino-4,6-dideoxygalactose transaminase